MKLVYHPASKEDLEETVRYYGNIDFELGIDFKTRFAEAIVSIVNQPLRYRVIQEDIRKRSV